MTASRSENQQKAYRALPSLSILLQKEDIQPLIENWGEGAVKYFARETLDSLRKQIERNPQITPFEISEIIQQLDSLLARHMSPAGRKAINATGILLHTGLGRAPLSTEAKAQLDIFDGYSILQTDIVTGERNEREARIEKLLIELTGCEAATVVNNNAAATMIILNTLSKNKEAIISRGQLVEIGGAFRIPDVMEQSQAILKEIGTTNRTHLKDYRNAFNENSGAILHVHTSNYRVRGFASTPNIQELCELRNEIAPNLPVIDDLGSGSLVPLSQFGLSDEPLIKTSLHAGADLCSFSGDKLICGPQAGIICGKKKWIDQINKNPYMRMFRVCKMTLAVLEASLMHFVCEDWKTKLPLYQMLTTPIDELQLRAERLLSETQNAFANIGYEISIQNDIAYIGSGSIPDEGIPSMTIQATPTAQALYAVQDLALKMRMNSPSIFGRISDNKFILDMRTLVLDDLEALIQGVNKVCST